MATKTSSKTKRNRSEQADTKKEEDATCSDISSSMKQSYLDAQVPEQIECHI
jgi:hypothetical protein